MKDQINTESTYFLWNQFVLYFHFPDKETIYCNSGTSLSLTNNFVSLNGGAKGSHSAKWRFQDMYLVMLISLKMVKNNRNSYHRYIIGDLLAINKDEKKLTMTVLHSGRKFIARSQGVPISDCGSQRLISCWQRGQGDPGINRLQGRWIPFMNKVVIPSLLGGIIIDLWQKMFQSVYISNKVICFTRVIDCKIAWYLFHGRRKNYRTRELYVI